MSKYALITTLIEKLPSLWKDFKNYLKHKYKEITMEDLIVCLRIEEDNKVVEKKVYTNRTKVKSNMIEDSKSKKSKKKKHLLGLQNLEIACAVEIKKNSTIEMKAYITCVKANFGFDVIFCLYF
ncbi:hypothetical protein Pfo_026773 [Paulownia fortunei]|nr:hypothetical protein Pfo_026773 [Paulownia fortunei]